MKLSFDEQGPFLLLGLDQVEEVGKWLIDRGVVFQVDDEASSSCAGPVVGVLRFEAGADATQVQAALDAWPGEGGP